MATQPKPVTIDTLGGISLRQHLINQGVTKTPSLVAHIKFILETERASGRRLDLSRYRVDPDDPNSFPPMMG